MPSKEIPNLFKRLRINNEYKEILNDEYKYPYIQTILDPNFIESQDFKDGLFEKCENFYSMLRFTNEQSEGEYEGGFYILKIILNKDYPNKPSDYQMLTPSGRFEINKNICISASSYHNNSWKTLWSVSLLTKAFQSMFEKHHEGGGGMSHIFLSNEERKRLANESKNYNIRNNKVLLKYFNKFVKSDLTFKTDDEIIKDIEEEIINKSKKNNDVIKEKTNKNNIKPPLKLFNINEKAIVKINAKINAKINVQNYKTYLNNLFNNTKKDIKYNFKTINKL